MPSKLVQIYKSVEMPGTTRPVEVKGMLNNGRLYGATGRGAVRKGNQDGFLLAHDPKTGFAGVVVGDGVGGHEKGEEANRIALESMQWQIVRSRARTIPQKSPLEKWFARATQAVFNFGQTLQTKEKPGTTLVALIGDLHTGRTFLGQTGDTRVFHLAANGEITLYHPDNSCSAETFFSMHRPTFPLVASAGQYYTQLHAYHDFCNSDPLRNVITSHIGDEPAELLARGLSGAHFSRIQAKPGDRFVFVTDGAYEAWSASQFIDMLRGGLAKPIGETIEEIFQASAFSGDNVTVAGVEYV